jgi:hypothetical protein
MEAGDPDEVVRMVAVLWICGDAYRKAQTAGLSDQPETAGYMGGLERARSRQDDRELCIIEATGHVQRTELFA